MSSIIVKGQTLVLCLIDWNDESSCKDAASDEHFRDYRKTASKAYRHMEEADTKERILLK